MARPSFTSLPPEITAKIVGMASNQEAAWMLRVPDQKERAGHINSLSALALVNKELRALAAKYQFRRLFSGKASRPVFRFSILPRYGHHITDARLHGSREASLDNLLAIMSQLPSLSALSFTHEAAIALFGPAVALPTAPSNGSDAAYRADMLEQISSQITRLSLHNFTPATSVALVRRFPNLKTLHLSNLNGAASEQDVKRLTSVISTLLNLKHLAVDLANGATTGWPTEAFGPLASERLPLQTLQLLWFPLDHHTLNLVALFGSTLKTLSLELRSSSPGADLSSRDPLQLPRLSTLNLTLSKSVLDVQHAIRIIVVGSNLSSLSYNRTNSGSLDPTMPALVAALDSRPGIRRVELGQSVREYPVVRFPPSKNLASPSSLLAYTALVHSRNLDPSVLDRPHLTPFHPDAKLDYTETEQPFLMGALRRTLEFGLVELDRIQAEGNVAKAVGWVEKLRPLKQERLAWKD